MSERGEPSADSSEQTLPADPIPVDMRLDRPRTLSRILIESNWGKRAMTIPRPRAIAIVVSTALTTAALSLFGYYLAW